VSNQAHAPLLLLDILGYDSLIFDPLTDTMGKGVFGYFLKRTSIPMCEWLKYSVINRGRCGQ
jgi:hypothetical protein